MNNNSNKIANLLSKRPIPNLKDTCKKYLEWVSPLLSQKEYIKTEKIVENFISDKGIGNKLQQELINWANSNNLENWTEPLWYDIYLESRKPLPINSNVFYLLEKNELFNSLSQSFTAAVLVSTILSFKYKIDGGTLEKEYAGKQELCMNQYKNLFSSTRIPNQNKDIFYKASLSKHIVVIHKGNLFLCMVIDNNGKFSEFSKIEEELNTIIKDDSKAQNLGILTTLNRNNWASLREEIALNDVQNKSLLQMIDNSIFILCLDSENNKNIEDTSKEFLHGNGINRWFDKSLQFIVSKDNRIGLNLEHTGFDGSIITAMCKYMYNSFSSFSYNKVKSKVVIPQKIIFNLNDKINTKIKLQISTWNNYISNFSTKVIKFTKFGNNCIKNYKLSPDAFVQLAFQLAQYKLFGKCYSSYEAVMARKFIHGRIEVSYCISKESLNFIKLMSSSKADNNSKYKCTYTSIYNTN